MRAIMTVAAIDEAYLSNPARDYPSRLTLKSHNAGKTVAFKNGEFADLVFFGYVERSDLLLGVASPIFSRNDSSVRKELEITLIAQEGERALSMLSMVAGKEDWALPVSRDGGIIFTTKYAIVSNSDLKARRSESL